MPPNKYESITEITRTKTIYFEIPLFDLIIKGKYLFQISGDKTKHIHNNDMEIKDKQTTKLGEFHKKYASKNLKLGRTVPKPEKIPKNQKILGSKPKSLATLGPV